MYDVNTVLAAHKDKRVWFYLADAPTRDAFQDVLIAQKAHWLDGAPLRKGDGLSSYMYTMTATSPLYPTSPGTWHRIRGMWIRSSRSTIRSCCVGMTLSCESDADLSGRAHLISRLSEQR